MDGCAAEASSLGLDYWIGATVAAGGPDIMSAAAAAAAAQYPGMERNCWVCFATDLDDRSAEWVSPCRCKGSTKWIHQSCLQRWLDEKQKGNSTGRVACPQCNTEYLIVFPKLGPVVYSLHQVDRILSRVSPFAAASIVVGTVYWSAVTYGAVTVMQVVGHKKGLDLMERADPLFLLMGLPTIPVMLILAKMIRWEDFVLRMWRKYSSKLQVLSSIFPGRDCLCRYQRGFKGLLPATAVPHPSQSPHSQLPREGGGTGGYAGGLRRLGK
ncbi:E3 ubiquitin-protein ligase MARCHF5-like isoform X2 [Leucoraja erinacea]|uniref:E3 ubiquitin-protein ligase MARCHF5-like isoform X2 n=1 Tax=Leucoraja erinaceus TaxID=7782 RepID=UPI0024588BB2|nr:E3 ubiquitin-protein ligase MARCHF5-like isoform X2 [Leucoraja erinacea]